MPKSKRAKVVALTQVKKKDRAWKEGLFGKVHALCDEYPAVYVFRYRNMRNDRFKELRDDLKASSRFMLASTKKLAAALGRGPEDEYKEGLSSVAAALRGHAGLLFTSLPHDEVAQLFAEFYHEDYARAGARATETVVLPAGPLRGPAGVPFPHTMEHTLRAHGLPTKLNKGVIELLAEHTVCKAGAPLTSHQAALLRHFEIKMAVFRVRLVGVWRAESGAYEALGEDDESDDDEDGDAGDALEIDDGLPASMMLTSET